MTVQVDELIRGLFAEGKMGHYHPQYILSYVKANHRVSEGITLAALNQMIQNGALAIDEKGVVSLPDN
jgi:hypothetical protein